MLADFVAAAVIYVSCACFTCVSFGLILTFSIILGIGVSNNSGSDHLVTTSPSYTQATLQTGHFDSEGVYQGGLPHWKDWTEDWFSCLSEADNGAYCQDWSTERYSSDADLEFLKGNCTCTRPNPDYADLTAVDDYYGTSSSEAALEEAQFCLAWECDETRYTQSCTCAEYTEETVCNRRRLRSSQTDSSCYTTQTCVSYDCVYIESSFYTACDCDPTRMKRIENGPSWWNVSTFCSDWRCSQGSQETTLIGDVEGDENITWASSSSTSPQWNGSISDDDAIEYSWTKISAELAYNCSEVDATGDWCETWRGTTEKDDYIEQLCECDSSSAASGETTGYCAAWRCTTYYMDKCQLCTVTGGALLGLFILILMAPLMLAGIKGHFAVLMAIPFGLSAAVLLAMFMGGVPAILEGILPASVSIIVLVGLIARFGPKKVSPARFSLNKVHAYQQQLQQQGLQGQFQPGVPSHQPGIAPQQQQMQQQLQAGPTYQPQMTQVPQAMYSPVPAAARGPMPQQQYGTTSTVAATPVGYGYVAMTPSSPQAQPAPQNGVAMMPQVLPQQQLPVGTGGGFGQVMLTSNQYSPPGSPGGSAPPSYSAPYAVTGGVGYITTTHPGSPGPGFAPGPGGTPPVVGYGPPPHHGGGSPGGAHFPPGGPHHPPPGGHHHSPPGGPYHPPPGGPHTGMGGPPGGSPGGFHQ